MNSLSIVIPVFNAEQSLEKLCEQLIPAMGSIVDDFEIILVDEPILYDDMQYARPDWSDRC